MKNLRLQNPFFASKSNTLKITEYLCTKMHQRIPDFLEKRYLLEGSMLFRRAVSAGSMTLAQRRMDLFENTWNVNPVWWLL